MLLLAGAMRRCAFASPAVMAGIHGAFWFMLKLWPISMPSSGSDLRFRRYRFDQLIALAGASYSPRPRKRD